VELEVSQAISCFLSILTDEIQHAVRMFRPQTSDDAYCLAKLQEATLQSMARRTRPLLDRNMTYTRSLGSSQKGPTQNTQSSHSQITGSSTSYSRGVPASSIGSFSSRSRTIRRSLSPKDIEEKRAKNLCFLFDEAYFLGHKCKAQEYSLEVVEEVQEDGAVVEGEEAELTEEEVDGEQ